MRRITKIGISTFVLILGYVCYIYKKDKLDYNKIDTENIEFGNIYKTVEASGVIDPVNIVQVGAQVSGQIKEIYVDYNSVVKKGDILAKIDPDILKRDVEEFEAALQQAKSRLNLKSLELKRNEELYENNYISKHELEISQDEYTTAKENYNMYKLRHEKAKVNLNYTNITSPLAGTVISREVDKGQTVAAGFSTPTLFRIAEDLTKMQILASISEADISNIKTGQKITFSVDTYQNRIFDGTIKEIRLYANVVQNIAVYSVVVSIDNSENLFLPGMSAYVNVITDTVEDVYKIKNIAIKFKPNNRIKKILGIDKYLKKHPEISKELKKDSNRVLIYKLSGKKIIPMVVTKGLSDITYTEISGDNIKKGDTIITDYLYN